MTRIGIEVGKATLNGRTYRRMALFLESERPERTKALIASAIVVVLFALSIYALDHTDVPDTHSTVNIGQVMP